MVDIHCFEGVGFCLRSSIGPGWVAYLCVLLCLPHPTSLTGGAPHLEAASVSLARPP